ncbi:MAG: hypothetical protein GTN78_03875, partial [Gemmatimonadales bacterium]|nr:hypothetical protein [Gemmatimonadales bacterium]
LWPCFPTWLTIHDRPLLEGFWTGDSTAYQWPVIRAWAIPAFWWATFMAAVMWVCLCLNSIVRRRWSDEEKLSFPYIVLPVQLVEERFGLLRNKLWWIGLAFSVLLGIWNAVGARFPVVPPIPLNFNFQPYLAQHPPWEAITYR